LPIASQLPTVVFEMKLPLGKFIAVIAVALMVLPSIGTAFANEAAPAGAGHTLHTSGGVRHPSYDPKQNRRGCPLVIKSVPGAFSMQNCWRLISDLERAHPKWRAYGRRNHANNTSMKTARNGALVWTVKLLGPPKGNPYLRGRENYIPFGELHVVAVNHRSYGRAGTILLDTLGNSPDL
jgi:hypothetical protein